MFPDPDEEIRASLRDPLPGYRGPADPMVRVGAAVRRHRRRRGQGWLTVLSAATVVAAVAALPTVLGLSRTTGGTVPTAALSIGSAQTGGVATGRGTAAGSATPGQRSWPNPAPRVYRVNTAEVGTARWAFGSTSVSASAHRCLYADDALFVRTLVCFDYWRAGAATTWTTIESRQPKQLAATAVVGVAPAQAASVVVTFSDGRPHTARAIRTPTDRTARFFAVVWPATGLDLHSVVALDAAGHPLHRPTNDPHGRACEPELSLYCGTTRK